MAKTFTREELEDIWQNKPYGHFTKVQKQIKGKKRFLFTVKAYKTVEIESETVEVWAKNANEVCCTYGLDLNKRIRARLGFEGWPENISFKYFPKEV